MFSSQRMESIGRVSREKRYDLTDTSKDSNGAKGKDKVAN